MLYSNFDVFIPLKVALCCLWQSILGMLKASVLVGLAVPQIKFLITPMGLLVSVRKEI